MEGWLARCPNGSRPLVKLMQDDRQILRATQRSGDPCGCSGGHYDHLVLEPVGRKSDITRKEKDLNGCQTSHRHQHGLPFHP